MPYRRWVFDTVTLSDFLLSDASFILAKRYAKKGLITEQVYSELVTKFSLRELNEYFFDRTFSLISLTQPEHELQTQFTRQLGAGEASSIAVAKQRNAIMVTNDRAARNQCKRIGIPITGTIGILKATEKDGLISIDQADDILERMIAHGFYSPLRSLRDSS